MKEKEERVFSIEGFKLKTPMWKTFQTRMKRRYNREACSSVDVLTHARVTSFDLVRLYGHQVRIQSSCTTLFYMLLLLFVCIGPELKGQLRCPLYLLAERNGQDVERRER